MTTRVLDLLPDYVLGTLDDADRREVEAALARSAELRAEAAEIAETFGGLALELTPITPSPTVKARLFEAVSKEERFTAFTGALARYFDLARARVEALIHAIDDAATDWQAGPLPGIQLMHFSGGPAAATADVGFVRLPPDLHFPWHRHLGHEVNFVLEGTLRDFDGRVYGPGEAIEKDAGTEHEFFVGPEGALIAVVVHEGFEIVPPPSV